MTIADATRGEIYYSNGPGKFEAARRHDEHPLP